MGWSFEGFVKDHIREYLPEEYREAEVRLSKVMKKYDQAPTALIIEKGDSDFVPVIYLDPYAEQFAGGRRLPSIMREIAQIRQDYDIHYSFQESILNDYGKVKPYLSIQMFDAGASREYLADKAFMPCGELAATYWLNFGKDGRLFADAAITERMLQVWGISKEQIHHDAVQAEMLRSPACLFRGEDVVSETPFSEGCPNLLDQEDVPGAGDLSPMYVLTNRAGFHGAGVISWDGMLEKVGDLLGTDFYVLPSSKHELIIMPDDGAMDVRAMEHHVREVNAGQVAPEEFLSNKVQRYDRASRTLGQAQKKGLLEQLAQNKEQIQGSDPAAPEKKQPARDDPAL